MSVSTLDGGTKVFFSRRLQEQQAGEDLIEKQNAEQGLMPIVGNEAAEYGYENENRAFTRWFLDGVQPELNFHAGRDVDRAADGVLHERGRGAGDRMETVKPAIVRAAAGQALSRREFGAVAASGLAVSLSRRSLGEGGFQRSAVTFGVQSYSFRDRPLADAIAGMQKLGLRSCELWQNHVEPREDAARRIATLARNGVDRHVPSRPRSAREGVDHALGLQHQHHGQLFGCRARARLRHDRRARRAAHHVVVEYRHGRAHCAGRRAAKDGGRRCTITRGSIPTSSPPRRA